MTNLNILLLLLTFLLSIVEINGNKHKSVGELTAIVETLQVRLEVLGARLSEFERLSKQGGSQIREGPPGREGSSGRDGLPGRDGRDGRDGHCPMGCNNNVEVPRLACPKETDNDNGIKKRSNTGSELESPITTTAPPKALSSFIRWGKKECPSGAEKVYTGRTTIQFMGSPVRYECPDPNQPKKDDKDDDDSKSKSKFLRFIAKPKPVRFNFGKNDPFPKSNSDKLLVPCAKCQTNTNSIRVFKSETSCPDNWNMLYEGLLMANNWNHIFAKEVCVDKNSEGLYEEVAPSRKAVLSPLLVTCNGESCGTNGDDYQRCIVCSSDV